MEEQPGNQLLIVADYLRLKHERHSQIIEEDGNLFGLKEQVASVTGGANGIGQSLIVDGGQTFPVSPDDVLY